jgi:hypothetical protein
MRTFGKLAGVVVVGVVGVARLGGCRPPLPSPGPGSGHHPGSAEASCAPIEASLAGQLPPPATPPAPSGPPQDDAVTVHLGQDEGPTNEQLLGLVWNSGANIQALAPIHPPTVRIDANLESRSRGPGDLDLSGLLARIAEVRSVGAEPLVLLSYMPRWLGEPNANGHSATRVAPYDLDLWQDLVEETVRTVATAPAPAYRFEVWNEPDLPIFWQDTPEAFADMAVRTHRAVAAVKAETGLPLEVGGPALAIGGEAFSDIFADILTPYVTRVVAAGLPLDFVSWHDYANAPYLGPDGPEGNLNPRSTKRSPTATPT